jgi:hypothetical protein
VTVLYATLQVVGLVALVVAAWMVAVPLGVAVAGVSALVVGAYAEHR